MSAAAALPLPPVESVPASWRAWATRPLRPVTPASAWEAPGDRGPVLLGCLMFEGPDAVRAAVHCAETLAHVPEREADQAHIRCLDDVPALLMTVQVRPTLLFRVVRATATAYPETLVVGAWLAEPDAVYQSRRRAMALPVATETPVAAFPWREATPVTASMLEHWCAPRTTNDDTEARARQERLLARLAMETTPGGVPPREGGTVAALRLRAGRCAVVSAGATALPLPSKATPGDVLTGLAGRTRLRAEVREAAARLGGVHTPEGR